MNLSDMKNLLREKMLRGEKCVGPFIWMGGPSVAEAMTFTNADFMVLDTEHGVFDIESVQAMIRAAQKGNVTCCARIKDCSRPSVLKMLDVGAQALIVPDVRSLEEVRQLVRYGKYFPVGERGVAFARQCGYGYADWVDKGDLQGFFDMCNRETLILPQCETKECLEVIEEVLQINGVDGIFIGPYDLSVGLGAPGKFDTPEFRAAMSRIYKACKEAEKFLFAFTFNTADCKKFFDMGANAVCLSSDVDTLINAMNGMIQEAKG